MNGCPITVWPDQVTTGRKLVRERQCGEQLAPGARFCVKHEADRIRLRGDAA